MDGSFCLCRLVGEFVSHSRIGQRTGEIKMPLVEGSSVLPDNAQNVRENALADVRFSDLALRLILREFRRMALSGFRRRTIGVII